MGCESCISAWLRGEPRDPPAPGGGGARAGGPPARPVGLLQQARRPAPGTRRGPARAGVLREGPRDRRASGGGGARAGGLPGGSRDLARPHVHARARSRPRAPRARGLDRRPPPAGRSLARAVRRPRQEDHRVTPGSDGPTAGKRLTAPAGREQQRSTPPCAGREGTEATAPGGVGISYPETETKADLPRPFTGRTSRASRPNSRSSAPSGRGRPGALRRPHANGRLAPCKSKRSTPRMRRSPRSSASTSSGARRSRSGGRWTTARASRRCSRTRTCS